MKRILCITESLGSGGAERQLTGLAVLLKNAGYEVKFVTYIKKQFYEQYLLDNNIDYQLIERAGNKYTRLYYIHRVVREFKPDAVISFLPSVNITMCLTKLFGGRFRLIVSERSHTNKLTLKQRITFQLYRKANYVVTNSYSEADNICNLAPYLKNKLRTITNFIDTSKFSPAPSKPVNNTIRIISVGRIIPVKNILNYMQAIRIVVDRGHKISVVWIGDNYDKSYYQRCLDLIETLHLEDIFKFIPQTNNIVSEYHNGDIFCLPSLYEGFPNVVCEAMGCGLPIVCSNVCDNPKIVEDGVNGILFNPLSIKDIAKALEGCINSNIDDMAENSRGLSQTKFSTEMFIQSYINLIK